MTNNNLKPIENKKPTETVYEIPSFEEFMKDYKVDESLNYDDLRGGDIRTPRGYGPMFRCQMQEQASIQEKQAIYGIFYASIERLERYIEISYKKELPDWENRKQTRDNKVKITDVYQYLERFESGLSNQLRLTSEMLENCTAPEFRWELKREFDKWISAAGVNADSSPERLKLLIFEINKVFGEISEALENCGKIEKYNRSDSDYLRGKGNYELLFSKEQRQINQQMTESFCQEPITSMALKKNFSAEGSSKSGRKKNFGQSDIEYNEQHLIDTFNKKWGKSTGGSWDGSVVSKDGEGGFLNLTASQRVSGGVGGALYSSEASLSVFKHDFDEGGDVRLISGTLGSEIGGGGLGGETIGYTASLDVVRASSNGVSANVGVDVGSKITAGFGGVEVKVVGFGGSIGKKIGFSTPIGGASIDLEEACVVQ